MGANNHKVVNAINVIQSLPDRVVGTAQTLKAMFDNVGEIVRLKHNDLCDYVDSDIATKAELQAVILGQVPDGSITPTKLSFSPLAEQNGVTQEVLMYKYFYDQLTANEKSAIEADSVLMGAINGTNPYNPPYVLPLDLFYNGGVSTKAGAFVSGGASAVLGANLVSTASSSSYYPVMGSLYMVKPIVLDDVPSTAKINITYTSSGGVATAKLSTSLPMVGHITEGSGRNYLFDASNTIKSVSMPISASDSTVTLDLSTLTYLRLTRIPLYLHFTYSTPYSGGTVTVTVKRIQIVAS